MKPTSYKRKKIKTVTLMFPLQFFIEAGLRGQVLRKTSLCGEKCTGNKPKWHREVQLSTMINGTYASWMCLVPLPCWLPLLRVGSRLLGSAWSTNLNPSSVGSMLTGWRRHWDCQELWLTMLLLILIHTVDTKCWTCYVAEKKNLSSENCEQYNSISQYKQRFHF